MKRDALDVWVALLLVVAIGAVGTAFVMGAEAVAGTAAGFGVFLAYIYVVVLALVRITR